MLCYGQLNRFSCETTNSYSIWVRLRWLKRTPLLGTLLQTFSSRLLENEHLNLGGGICSY